MAGQDVLDADAFAEHEGGFAAAAAALGAKPAAVSRSTRTGAGVARVRTAGARRSRASLRARAANPRWIAGQMRHGHRGAAEIAETRRQSLRLGGADGRRAGRQFDLLFDATCGDERVRALPR